MSSKLRRRSDLVSASILYLPHQGLNPALLDRIDVKPYSGRTISTPKARLLRVRAVWPLAVSSTPVFLSTFDGKPDLNQT